MNPFSDNKKLIYLSIVTIIIAIICVIFSINNSKKDEETFSQLESYNNYLENIITVELPSSSNAIEENITNDVTTNTTTDNNSNEQNINNSTYYIKVNYGANVVTIYSKDSSGNYSVPVKAMICSTGSATPKSGVYKMDYKYRWLALFGNVYGQYCTRIVGNILFHSVPYLRNGDPASLEYWEYDKLGTTASAGCIRLKVEDAMWIYNNCSSGTMVEFYSSSNPGPLGKPSAPKISQYNSPYKDWDPTDPNSANPWKNNPSSNNNIDNSNKTITNDIVDNSVDNNISENNTEYNNNSAINNSVKNNLDSDNIFKNEFDNLIEN